jgi:hypothetical protein
MAAQRKYEGDLEFSDQVTSIACTLSYLHLPPFGEKINSKLECPKNTSSTPIKPMFYSKSSNWRDQNKKPAWE